MKKKLILKLWKSKLGELFWHLNSPNGNILCDGGEGYKRRKAMEKAILLVLCGADPFPTNFSELTEIRPDIRVEDTIPHGKK